MSKGTASEQQQRVALRWIMLDASRAGKEVFVPNRTNDTAYNAGRLSVSLQIGWALGQPVEAFRKPGETE